MAQPDNINIDWAEFSKRIGLYTDVGDKTILVKFSRLVSEHSFPNQSRMLEIRDTIAGPKLRAKLYSSGLCVR